MARVTVEDCLEKESNRFLLVILAARRAKQLLRGSPLVLGEVTDNKQIVNALREVADGKVRFLSEEEIKNLEAAGETVDDPADEELLGVAPNGASSSKDDDF